MISRRAQRINPSPTLGISAKATQMRKEGLDIISFGAGEPDYDTPEHIKEAGIQAVRDGFTKYTATSGIPELKQAIITKFKKDNGLTYSSKQILVSNGAKQCLTNILHALIDPGDEVLIPVPYWVSYEEMVKLVDGKCVFVPAKKDFKIDVATLKKYITPKTKALILNSPSNPTGAVYDKTELMAIAKLCVKKNIYVLSDEIYEKLIYEKEHVSIAAFGEDIKQLSIVINGVSKTYSMTGWRIGYCAGPKDIIQAASSLQDHTTSSPNSMAQKAAVVALTGQVRSVETMKREFKKRRNYMMKRLHTIRGISAQKPDGAFYIFVDVSKLYTNEVSNSSVFCEKLLSDFQVAVVPGKAFGADRCIRLSFATSMEHIKKGLDRIEAFAKSIYKGK